MLGVCGGKALGGEDCEMGELAKERAEKSGRGKRLLSS